MKVLDVCCGSRMMWFDKANDNAIFIDKRTEQHTLCDGRSLEITPDFNADFRELPFADCSFSVVVFDPPHLVNAGDKSWLKLKYSKLEENWRDDLTKGFSECFRVLKKDGVLIFKWNETQVKVSEILALTQVRPLFGHKSGKSMNTHWITFLNL